ncbi:MAG: DUF2490 domain-containing protein [Flavobacteriaceae bacterium]|jgi:hypothetical protein|nr:DUF2490 domain-containing protein [Flavobacteriaceae bacterium]
MRKIFLLLLFVSSRYLLSQSGDKEHLSGFGVTSITYKHDKKWSAYLELQMRSIENFSLPDYYEMKGGIGYNVAQGNQVFVGIGKYGTYRNSDFYQREFRLWLQYTLSHNIHRLKIDHRIRAEKRFYYFPQTDTKSNTERFRYRLSLTLPINKEKVESNTFFVNGYEEIFVGPEDPFFKRNRFFAGGGYQFNDNISGSLGYMWQRDFSIDSAINLHFLYFGISFTFNRLTD